MRDPSLSDPNTGLFGLRLECFTLRIVIAFIINIMDQTGYTKIPEQPTQIPEENLSEIAE